MKRLLKFVPLLLLFCFGLQATPVELGILSYSPGYGEYNGQQIPITFGFTLALFDSSVDPAFNYSAPPLNTMPLRFDGIQRVIDVEDTSSQGTVADSYTYIDSISRSAISYDALALDPNEAFLQKSVNGDLVTRKVTRATLTASILPGVAWRVFNGSEYVYFIPNGDNYTFTDSFTFSYSSQGVNIDNANGAIFPLVISGFTMVPEPSSMGLAALGLVAFTFAGRKRSN